MSRHNKDKVVEEMKVISMAVYVVTHRPHPCPSPASGGGEISRKMGVRRRRSPCVRPFFESFPFPRLRGRGRGGGVSNYPLYSSTNVLIVKREN
ncbi:MAG: hypothetical protein WAV05_06085 [Anaerolineales bacterium]